MKYHIIVFLIFISISNSIAQSSDDILNLLVKNKTITQFQADSIKVEAKKNKEAYDTLNKPFFFNKSKLFQLSGYTQLRYQNLEEPNQKDGFDIHLARIDMTGDISKYFGYRLQVGFIGMTKLFDIYGECKVTNYFNLRFGQFKVPFSMENLTSPRVFEFIDNSNVVDALVIRGYDIYHNQAHEMNTDPENYGRDIGIQLYGNFLKINNNPLIDYALGIFNGSGINKSDNNESKSFAGRLIFHPLKGLNFGGSFYEGYDYYSIDLKNNECSRKGFELSYEHNRFSFRGEYIQGIDDYSEREGMMDINQGFTKRFGWYVQTGFYIIPQKLQLLIKYDRYERNRDFPSYASVGYISVINYNFNKWSRIQAGYTFLDEQGENIISSNKNKAVIQFQLGF